MGRVLDQDHHRIAIVNNACLREQLASWLKLMEVSGIGEVFVRNRVGSGWAIEGKPDRDLEALKGEIEHCSKCTLHKQRKNVVFGEGNLRARLMFVGEAPGRDEDIQGRPFVGMAGKLLTKIIEAMGLRREDVYITNVVKCRPPNNRVPEIDEIAECLLYLEKQISAIRPEVICALGSVATRTLTGLPDGVTSLRGKFYNYMGIPVMPTFHPAACLRKPEIKRLVWDDVKKVMQLLGLQAKGVITNGAGKGNI